MLICCSQVEYLAVDRTEAHVAQIISNFPPYYYSHLIFQLLEQSQERLTGSKESNLFHLIIETSSAGVAIWWALI